MKIAILADNFPAPGRPKFVFVQQLVFALVDIGHQVSVIAPQSITHALLRGERLLPRHKREQTSHGNCFDVYRPYDVSFGNGKQWLYNLTANLRKRGVQNALEQIQPEVLYGHFWHSAYKLKDYAIAHQLPLFVACGEGDNALEDLVAGLPPQEKQELVGAVAGVISVSSENKRKCIEFGLANEEQIIVLPNCVDTSLFYPQTNHNKRKELGVKESDFLIAFTGGFIHRKGAGRLAAAIEKIQQEDIKVIFIGQPMKGDSDIPQCPGIVYMGGVAHDQIPEYLCCADVFVLPTLKEGCCNAIVEALAMAIPVISADRPFNDDILDDSNSIRVNPMDIDAIANAILEMKNDRKIRMQMKLSLQQHHQKYSIHERAKHIVDFINSFIQNKYT